jgi:hypothetical protein
MTLNLTIITTKKEEQMKVCSVLKILAEELDPTIVCLEDTNVKLEQQKIFGGHQVFSKTVHADRAKDIKAERLEFTTKLNAVPKSRTRTPIKKKEVRKQQNEM